MFHGDDPLEGVIGFCVVAIFGAVDDHALVGRRMPTGMYKGEVTMG